MTQAPSLFGNTQTVKAGNGYRRIKDVVFEGTMVDFKSISQDESEEIEEAKIELEKGRHEYPYDKKYWPVAINADIDARGGMKGKGTSVTLFLKDKNGKKVAKGFQGPATMKSVSDFIKKWSSKGFEPNDEAEGFNESKDVYGLDALSEKLNSQNGNKFLTEK